MTSRNEDDEGTRGPDLASSGLAIVAVGERKEGYVDQRRFLSSGAACCSVVKLVVGVEVEG